MHPPISETDIAVLIDEADAAARRLLRRLRLPQADLDDLRQDFLVDLVRRLPAFDARRGSIGAFAGIISRNQASRIAGRVARERRATGGGPLSLDVPDRDGLTIGDRLGAADGLGAWHGQRAADADVIDERIDLARAIGAIARRDLRFCAAMAHCPIQTLAKRGFGSRATLYRRLHNLRCVLAAHGARPA